ncbi:hypothetical protein LOF27_13670 [Xanthomonas euvesicatoria]|uniref:hypothetical protein n=1 Tax=Xanthomonas euvesicatoria TaxID=456327 RepID=UPI002404ECEF|nr:hypothetical protein [Xanthomonas euvesicatoria]MCC8914409.1 hypothetical protein [Xanthomonas euvesicatoria]
MDLTTEIFGAEEGGNRLYYPANGSQPEGHLPTWRHGPASPGDARFGQMPHAPIHALAPCVRPHQAAAALHCI